MRRGFIFDQDLCVDCKACSAACILENGFTVKPRHIFTSNPEASASLPLTNISMACNHCEIPVCMTGCPASAYTRDQSTGVVIIDDKKCIGCRYCIWNCPYDAPKYDPVKGVVGKCHLCYSRLDSEMMPACTDACPTGALNYGNIDDFDDVGNPPWFPDKKLNPALIFTESKIEVPLKIVPSPAFKGVIQVREQGKKTNGSVWSLIMFSFLTVLSVSLLASSFIKGLSPDKLLFFSLTLLPAVFSVFHLGKWTGAWRALTNIRESPLSREILLFIIYVVISCCSVIYEIPWMIVSSSLIGLFLLIAIDSVYVYSARSNSVLMHGGQTFLSSLLIISFLSGTVIPFIFISFIKVFLFIGTLRNRGDRSKTILRFLRIAFLIVSGASLISGISYPEPAVIALFLSGELIDRILFYSDFEPGGLAVLINNHIASVTHEKERD
jgi:Fe-S-cluster-containing dehydrogenase component/DMSO reductase anchor subunit